MPGQFDRDRLGERRHFVEVQVPRMPGEFTGHRQREAEQPVQMEVRLPTPRHVCRAVVGSHASQRHAVPPLGQDRVVGGMGEAILVECQRSLERFHELACPQRV